MTVSTPADPAQVVALHGQGLGPLDIAARIGGSPERVRRMLRAEGIRLAPARGKREYRARGLSNKQLPVPSPEQLVDRDPCFWCGVRGDIGCEHRRAL